MKSPKTQEQKNFVKNKFLNEQKILYISIKKEFVIKLGLKKQEQIHETI
jgi:hypothetical protein